MTVDGYTHFGGRHGEAAAIRHLLAFQGVIDPTTGRPFTEALCFGIAGGIGAGYSYCPSVVGWGRGSGVSVVGRHKQYATDAAWYQGFCDRIGATTRITETAAKGKAYRNLVAELSEGRPAVVVLDPGQPAGPPLYFMLIDWRDGRLLNVRDFRYARYVVEGAELSLNAL